MVDSGGPDARAVSMVLGGEEETEHVLLLKGESEMLMGLLGAGPALAHGAGSESCSRTLVPETRRPQEVICGSAKPQWSGVSLWAVVS